jgi:hypothetical protein
VHLHDVVDLPGPRRHLGRMIRAALLAGERLHGPDASRTWQAAISLADSVTMPALHVNAHNIGRPLALAAQDRPWHRDVQRAPYAPTMDWRRVGSARYRIWVDRDARQTKDGFPVVATATDLRGRPLTPEALKDSRHDDLVGKMFLDVHRVCEAYGLRHGQIELDRRGAELVVKAHVWPREDSR